MRPVTSPVALMVATAVLLLVQVPPAIASARVAEPPTQTMDGPVIAPASASGLMTMVLVATEVEQAVASE